MCSVTIDHNIYLYGQEVKVMCYYCTIDTGKYPGGTNGHIVTEYILATGSESYVLILHSRLRKLSRWNQ